MARVTTNEVKEIIETSSTDLSAFIAIATILVDEKLEGSGLDDDTLKEVERWLAAHFLTCKERQKVSTKAGESEDRYNAINGTGLNSSTYGQTALLLDTTGTLSSIGKQSVSIDVLMDLPTDSDY